MRLGSAKAASQNVLPLPRNRGLPRLRIVNLRKSGKPDLRRGEGWGEGLRSLFIIAPPHPICAGRCSRIARSKSTSPQRGPQKGRGKPNAPTDQFNRNSSRSSNRIRHPRFCGFAGRLLERTTRDAASGPFVRRLHRRGKQHQPAGPPRSCPSTIFTRSALKDGHDGQRQKDGTGETQGDEIQPVQPCGYFQDLYF